MQIKPISFGEVNREYFFGDMSEVFLKINNILKEEWRGYVVEIDEFNINIDSKWFSDDSLKEIVKSYNDVGWNVTTKEDQENYVTLIFKEQE